jgi:hypothetical protein
MEFKRKLSSERASSRLTTLAPRYGSYSWQRAEKTRTKKSSGKSRERSQKLRNGGRRRAGGLESRNTDLELKYSGSWAELIFCSNLLPRAFCLFQNRTFTNSPTSSLPLSSHVQQLIYALPEN